jgi:hypothetical protein
VLALVECGDHTPFQAKRVVLAPHQILDLQRSVHICYMRKRIRAYRLMRTQ